MKLSGLWANVKPKNAHISAISPLIEVHVPTASCTNSLGHQLGAMMEMYTPSAPFKPSCPIMWSQQYTPVMLAYTPYMDPSWEMAYKASY